MFLQQQLKYALIHKCHRSRELPPLTEASITRGGLMIGHHRKRRLLRQWKAPFFLSIFTIGVICLVCIVIYLRYYIYSLYLRYYAYFIKLKPKIHSSCEIEYFVETHLCLLCVILRSRVLRVVCLHYGYRSATPLATTV